jgi:hypothetical protein
METVEEPLSLTASTPSDRAPVATPDALAVRALLGGLCSQQRVSDLFGVSRRTIGRLAEAEDSTAMRDPQRLECARTCLEETAGRGSTIEERDSAAAWLAVTARDAHQGAVTASRHVQQPDRPLLKPDRPKTAAPRPVSPSRGRKARVHVRRPPRTGAHRAAASTAVIPDPPAPRIPVDALRRQQQRILHHSTIVNYILMAETRSGAPLTMGDALAELLGDISEAARTIGTILQTTNGRP